LALSAASAQADQGGPAIGNSDLYVVQIPIEKIYPHAKGYVVEYRKNALGTSQMFIPAEWYTRHTDTKEPLKCEIVKLGPGKVWPYVALYYKAGVVDHVRLFVRKEPLHPSWGMNIDNGTKGVDENFENVENIKIIR
jgi:hypothetical protein